MTITLATIDNQNTINFRECELKLRQHYHIPENEKIYMKETDVKQKSMKISKIEYDLYCKFNSSKLIKLDLSYCGDIKIDLSIILYVPASS